MVDYSKWKKMLAEGISIEQQEVLNRELAELDEKVAKFDKRSKLQPWNVDTISSDGWSSTVLNNKCLGQNQMKEDAQEITEEEMTDYEEHVRKYEAQIKEFAFHSRFEDCRRYLLAHPDLVNSFTLDYMSLWCMQLQLYNKKALLEHVSGQAVMIQLILDMAKTVGGGIDPRSCLTVFFDRSAQSKAKFDQLFAEELDHFKGRIDKATQLRIEREFENQELNPELLVGPGGLNCQEVFDSLPPDLQKCFESRSREQLLQVLSKMEPELANYHLKRCTDAGLWTIDRAESDEDEQMLSKILEKQNQQQPLCSTGDVDQGDLHDSEEDNSLSNDELDSP